MKDTKDIAKLVYGQEAPVHKLNLFTTVMESYFEAVTVALSKGYNVNIKRIGTMSHNDVHREFMKNKDKHLEYYNEHVKPLETAKERSKAWHEYRLGDVIIRQQKLRKSKEADLAMKEYVNEYYKYHARFTKLRGLRKSQVYRLYVLILCHRMVKPVTVEDGGI